MIDCAFCDEFAQPVEDTWLVASTEDRVVLPTIGCLTEGYLLYMPRDHTLAFADFDEVGLKSSEADLEALRADLQRRYGPVLLAEHGPRECDLGAGCCDHAHMHLIPVPDTARVQARYEEVGGAAKSFGTLQECLASIETAYVYLSPEPGVHQVWPADAFPRQWVRRVCAAEHGRAEAWDWRDHPFDADRSRTYDAVCGRLPMGETVPVP